MENLFNNVDLSYFEDFDVTPKGEEGSQEGDQEGGKEAPTKKKDKPSNKPEEPEDNTFEIPEKDTESGEDPKEPNESGKEPSSNDKGSSSSSPFKPFVNALVEEGFLEPVEDEEFEKLVEEEGSEAAALMELARRTIQNEVDEYKKNSEEEYKAFLEARDSGVNMDEWSELSQARTYYNSLSDSDIDEDEDLQKRLIEHDLKTRGFDVEQIKDHIEALEASNKLAQNAKRAKQNALGRIDKRETDMKEEVKKRKEDEKKEAKKNLENLRKEIDGYNEIVPGIKINKQTKDRLYNLITTESAKGKNGESLNLAMAKRAENPIKYAIIEAYLVELGVFDGKWDKVALKTKTKALTELEKTLSEQKNTNYKGNGRAVDESSADDFRLPIF